MPDGLPLACSDPGHVVILFSVLLHFLEVPTNLPLPMKTVFIGDRGLTIFTEPGPELPGFIRNFRGACIIRVSAALFRRLNRVAGANCFDG